MADTIPPLAPPAMQRQQPTCTIRRPGLSVALPALLLVTAQGCASMQNACIYQPAPYPDGDWSPAELNYEDAWFNAADGTQLHGWYVPCEQPDAVVLFAHGIRGNVTTLTPQLRDFCDRHCASVMVFDYRGYGRSSGSPDEAGLYQDAAAARDWLANRAGIHPQDVVLMGRSIGAAVVVDLAARDGARGLILESTFTSLPDVVQQHTPGIPVDWLMACRFDSLEKIGRYRGPLLISHGELDRLIPIEQGRALHAAANPPKRFVTIPAAGHRDPQDANYHQKLEDFLVSLPPVTLARLPELPPAR